MIKGLCFFAFFLLSFNVKAQKTVAVQPTFYTHEFLAKIAEVDTIILVSNDYTAHSDMPEESFKALCIRVKFISKIKGNFRGISKAIIIELLQNEHNCLFNFKTDKVYKIYASTMKYSSDFIKKKYRKKFFQLDCYNIPVVQ